MPVRNRGLEWIRRYAPVWPLLSWTLFGIGSLYCVAAIAGLVGYPADPGDPVAGDAWNYWAGQPYASEHYRYSPAFYWATLPLRALPFEAFAAIWALAHLAALAWLGPWTVLVAFDDVIRGNINTFLAVGVVFAVRGQAWTWAAVLLTKVTPGIGILHHVARREWGRVAMALGVTVAVAGAGALLAPGLWADWVGSLRAGTTNYQTIDALAPLPVRLAAATVLAVLSGRRIWLLPVAIILAMPGLLPSSFALLAAMPRLLRSR